MNREILTALAVIPLLAACSSAGGSGRVRPPRPTAVKPAKPVKAPVRSPAKRPPPPAEVHMAPGLEGVIGASASQLTRRFGTPRLDVWEGDARKLQFSGTPCILDVYLYPSAPGREPQATYVEARRASDGRDVDRADCAAALRRP
jgi:hypothetical protein